jgi:hypothetical protein
MSPELVAIIAMGFLIIGVQMTIFIYTMQRIDKLSDRIASMEVETKESISSLRVEMTERVARLEGIVIARTESGNGTVGAAGDD